MPSLNTLLSVQTATSPLRAYAYLTATMRSRGEDADILDCLLPFIKVALQRQPHGSIFSVNSLAASLKSFGLQVPDLVLQQLAQRLENDRLLETKAGTTFIKHLKTSPAYADKEIILDNAFDRIDQELAQYARERYGIEAPPVSTSWDIALLHFLKDQTSLPSARQKPKNEKPLNIGSRLVGDKDGAEELIVGNFIQECDGDPGKTQTLNNITQVFAGILIEDFIGNVQSLGARTDYSSLRVYYDTTVLLRLLGTSGRRLRLATLEIHKTLQSLGCLTHFLEITRSEVKRILDGIAENPSQSHPETANAYQNGELDRSLAQELVDTFEVQLDRKYGISRRPKPNIHKSLQIDEDKLKRIIVSEADGYLDETAAKDAQVVGIILQLRRGETSDEIGHCKHIFISMNSLLQKVTRKFVENNVEEYRGTYGSVPPILTIGQISTLGWLSAPHDLQTRKITKELITACYNAVMPSKDWLRQFNRVIGEYAKERPEIVAKLAESAIFHKTTRILMQEASLNQAKLIPTTNVADIVQRAIEEGARKNVLSEQKHQEEVTELLDQLQTVQSRVAELERAKAEQDAKDRLEEEEFAKGEEQKQKERAAQEATKQKAASVDAPVHVVVLVHGIRDHALWQNQIGLKLSKEGFKVERTNYGRLNLIEFLTPIGYFRRRAVGSVWKQIRMVRQKYGVASISVIAHSFGTYVISRMMREEFDIKFNRVIFCGSVVKYDFPFEQVNSRFCDPILNDVGTRDVWPAMAESVTLGYGSAGTYGFHRPLVLDRWHNGAGHNFFLKDDRFCEKFWIPFLRDGTVELGAVTPEEPRWWIICCQSSR